MKQKILFTIVPKVYWLLLVLDIILISFGGEYLSIANLGFNAFFILIGIKIAIFIHEIGHLLFAKIAGGTPRRIILGKGHKVTQTTLFGVKIVLNSNFNSGLAYAAFNNLKNIKIKLFIYSAGGALSNLILIGLIYLLFGFNGNFTENISFFSAIIVANIFTCIIALLPFYTNYQGLKLQTDGLALFNIPFYEKSKLVELSSVNEILDTYDLLEEKKYKDAIKIYEIYKSKSNTKKTININISIAYMKLGNYKKAVSLLTELLPLIEEKHIKPYKIYIYNNLAWVNLLLNNLHEANEYSELAYNINPNIEYIRGTRGSVLIEKGEIEEGKNLLKDNIDFKYPNNVTLSASIFLSLAYTKLSMYKKAKKHIQFVTENINILEVDEKFLYDKAFKEIKELNISLINN